MHAWSSCNLTSTDLVRNWSRENTCMYGGKTRNKNRPIGNKILKQIGTHDHAEKTPDCRLNLASNEGSLVGQRKWIPIHFDVNKEMLSRIIFKASFKQKSRYIRALRFEFQIVLIFCFLLAHFRHVFCLHTKRVFSPIFFHSNSPDKGSQVKTSRSIFVYFRQ